MALDKNEIEMQVQVNKFHLWALDKGHVICEINIDIQGGNNFDSLQREDGSKLRTNSNTFRRDVIDGVKWHIRSKLMKKWC